MSFVIAIDTARWQAHQDRVRDAVAESGATLVPVAKGNGYGVGNLRLGAETVRLGLPTIAVGTVHEVAAMLTAHPGLDVLVLEPLTLRNDDDASAWRTLIARADNRRVIATISSVAGAEDLATLATVEQPRRILMEGLTSIRRFGMTEDELAGAIAGLARPLAAGSVVLEGLALHLPIAAPEHPRVGSMSMLTPAETLPQPVVVGSARVHEVVAWGLLWPALLANLAGTTDAGTLWVSHLDDRECLDVRTALPDLPLAVRIGTRLWLGDRRALRAQGRVLAVHVTNEGQSAGYHQRRAPRDGHIVVVAGGTSHGVAMSAPRPALNVRQRAAAAGEGALEAVGRFRSPFHLLDGATTWFQEPPHMHVSMLRLTRGVVPPTVGELIDCDVRFTTVHPDVVLG